METTPRLQRVITRLMAKHEDAFFHAPTHSRLTLRLGEEKRLAIYVAPGTVRVARQIDSDGFAADPDITFAAARGEWSPVSRRVSPERTWFGRQFGADRDPERQVHYALPITRNLVAWRQGQADVFHDLPGMKDEQAQTALLCEQWAHELERQGWLERAMRLKRFPANSF